MANFFNAGKCSEKLKQSIAVVLLIVMAMSNLSISQVYANTASDGDAEAVVVEETSVDDSYDSTKIDVWDFGAEQLDSSIYNNMLNADLINSWYDQIAPGSVGVNLSSFVVDDGELSFDDGGYTTTHRLRTTNTELTRYDSKSLTGTDGTAYSGYIYSNKSATSDVSLGIKASAGDIIMLVVSSNGGDSTICFEGPDGSLISSQIYSGGSPAKIMTFYAPTDGTYKVYSADEKLVVARIYRQHTSTVTVTGSITAPETLADYQIVFTNRENGSQTIANVDNGTYSIELNEMYTYDISLEGANGYVIISQAYLYIEEGAGNTELNITVENVNLICVSGEVQGLTEEVLAKAQMYFTSDSIYQPTITFDGHQYYANLEIDVQYTLMVEGIDDYALSSPSVYIGIEDYTQDIIFEKKPVYDVSLVLEGVEEGDLEEAVFTFTNLEDTNYVYSFVGSSDIKLRDGVYSITVSNTGNYIQKLTSNLTVEGASITKTIVFEEANADETIEYQAEVTVGASNCDYTSINDALSAVGKMQRPNNERVTILIEPGNYEEMLVVDIANVTLKNASATPSLELQDEGVNISENAVRITSYYGHGYSYYSMGDDCKYSEEVLNVNKENGYESFTNPGAGSTSYWNATVVVSGSGFQSECIIFENSFNQYVSQKAANDIIVKLSSAKEGDTPRADMLAEDTTVQNKAYVERAAALAITANVQEVFFDNCKFIGRQDTLYGGSNTTAAFYDCAILGGTDYIFGGMTAVFAKCDLVFNTSESSNDVGYITAPQQTSGRGYLMYNCQVTSTTPSIDTASEYTSKAGYFGRPWAANTGEAVFYYTIIDATDSVYSEDSPSMILPIGWASTLSGESVLCVEYATYEMAEDVDNSANRASWASVLDEPILGDGTAISVEAFLNDWDPFAEKDMTLEVPEDESYETATYILDVTTIDATGVTDKDVISEGTIYSGYFKTVGTVTQRVSSSTGKTTAIEVEKAERGKIQFTVTGTADVLIKMSSTGASNESAVALVDDSGNVIENKEGISVVSTTEATEMTYEGLSAGNYYIVSPLDSGRNRGARVLYAEVKEVTKTTTRAEWSSVPDPVIQSVTVLESTIEVDFDMLIGENGADKVIVTMKDSNGEEKAAQSFLAEGTSGTVTFTPDASGNYSFSITAEREGEEAKQGQEVTAQFVLPLKAPNVRIATNVGEGSVLVKWNAVAEAEYYEIAVADTDIKIDSEELSAVIEGLTVGQTYTISVVAVRGEDRSTTGTISVLVSDEARTWSFTTYGESVNTTNNGYEGDANFDSLRVYSLNNSGKLVPASTDGVAFYYTTLDAKEDNFILSAKVQVNEWALSNGQEGFGLMVADTVGVNGDESRVWNNSYMASVTKVDYYWDSANKVVSDAGTKISMKLGVGAQEKIGATGPDTDVSAFVSTMATLESSCGPLGSGTYNIVGNYSNVEAPTGTLDNLVTEFDLTIQRNNTGYRISYTDQDGNTTTKLYYDIERENLNVIDEDYIYLGFFAARNADVTFSDISLTTTNTADDEPPEEKEVSKVTPSYSITSASVSNESSYELVYRGNADGNLYIEAADGTVVVENAKVSANTDYAVNVSLLEGANKFTISMTPDEDFVPGENSVLSSYETKTFSYTVTYQSFDGKYLYVTNEGSAAGDGTKENPLDIYTAVSYVTPGQTIVLGGGVYNLSKTVVVYRGIDGTKDALITMVGDPNSDERPVFDFGGNCAGMILAGNYWYFKDFDVTNSSDAQKGIQVSGSNNTLDRIDAYYNGNTGIQISQYKSTDNWEKWPANNLILNCTSYGNADKGYEDADGFAAKLTVGDGNVFDGCIAYNNADDGWDLFAKVETGAIGSVIIKNSVAYANGYLEDGTDAGNGNGFKMGGSSITGYHTLINSVSFNNKAKGIDSNSCPDIQVENSTTFNNESYNVAFYTTDADYTDFGASGIMSFRTLYKDVSDQIKLSGTQDESKVYGKTNYYWNAQSSSNSVGEVVSEDWFVSLQNPNITRNEDGTIQMNGYLELTDKVPSDAGARMTGTPSAVIAIDKTEQDTLTITGVPEIITYGDAAFTLNTTGGSCDGAVTWSSSDISIATVNETTGEVTIVGVGVVTITATKAGDDNYNDTAASVTLTVNKAPTTTYTLTFETNGGSSFDSITETEGTVLNLSEFVPTKEGYIFDGWYSDKDLKTKVTEITLSSDTVVYAKWVITHMPYINGYTDGTFKPDISLSRAEAAQLLYNISGKPGAGINSEFSDVNSSEWCYTPIISLADSGIINGYEDGTFRPDDIITRAELVALIVRYVGLTEGEDLDYSDVPEDHWAAGYIAAATKAEYIEGYPGGSFKPEVGITRAEVVKILNYVLERGADEEILQDLTMPFSDVDTSHWAYYEILEAAVEYTH